MAAEPNTCQFDYTLKTRGDFDDYVGCHFDPSNIVSYGPVIALESAERLARMSPGISPTTGSSNLSSSTFTTKPPSCVTGFMKGVKRDSSAFPDFKKDAEWDKFRRHCIATAHAQQVHEVFDPYYSVLADSDEAKVFQLKKDYVYSMLTTNLKTLKGMEIAKAHEFTRDTQQVFADLADHYTTSIAASTREQVMFEKITVTTVPETRRESLEKYITTFNDWIREYNLISPDKMNDKSRLIHFNTTRKMSLNSGTPPARSTSS